MGMGFATAFATITGTTGAFGGGAALSVHPAAAKSATALIIHIARFQIAVRLIFSVSILYAFQASRNEPTINCNDSSLRLPLSDVLPWPAVAICG
jgi:hypothetical protein